MPWVKQQDARLDQDRARQGDTLPLAAGECQAMKNRTSFHRFLALCFHTDLAQTKCQRGQRCSLLTGAGQSFPDRGIGKGVQ